MITDHEYVGELKPSASCQYVSQAPQGITSFSDEATPTKFVSTKVCGRSTGDHKYMPGMMPEVIIDVDVPMHDGPDTYGIDPWPKKERRDPKAALPVRVADLQQYERAPMPEAARKRIVVTLIDAPVDPLGTMAVIGGIYTGRVARSKEEVTDDQRKQMLIDMQNTALNGPLESIQFTFLVEGVSRAITHQMVRNRFAFYAQESLRFAVAEDWAAEVPLPPSLAGLADDDPQVGVWRRALHRAEDAYAALVATGMPAEEARGLLPHAITTRLYWTVSLRSLLAEAGKRTCTQAQFDWRVLFAGVASALRARGGEGEYTLQYDGSTVFEPFLDNWQYRNLARLMRPMCYQEGGCKMMASFDRGCSIRSRVDAFEQQGIPAAQWPVGSDNILPIHDWEWAADPSAARVTE